MATFNININNVPPVYSSISKNTLESSCTVLANSYSVGLIDTAGGNNVFNIINSYTGKAWKDLVITNIVLTNPGMNLTYNGADITNSMLPLSFDISAINDGDSIPLLFVNETFQPVEYETELITIYFYIKDVDNIPGNTESITFQVTGDVCVVPPINEPTIVNLITSEVNGTAISTFSINGVANTTYKYHIVTSYNGTNGYYASLQDTTTLAFLSPNSAPGTGNSVDGTYTLDGTGNINLKYSVTPNGPVNYGQENCVAVSFMLYKTDGITLNTSEDFPMSVCTHYYN